MPVLKAAPKMTVEEKTAIRLAVFEYMNDTDSWRDIQTVASDLHTSRKAARFQLIRLTRAGYLLRRYSSFTGVAIFKRVRHIPIDAVPTLDEIANGNAPLFPKVQLVEGS